jgi:probable F420-dependent oxidoreductase
MEPRMRFGLFAINMGVCARPEIAVRVAQAAEAAGFESVWSGEHVVLPDPRVAPSPLPPEHPLLDPAVALAFIAGQTRTIGLGTGIIILPQRNPLVLAKELASLDVVSGGRLIFGIGAGYLAPEFAALGIPFDDRGARTDEYLRAIMALWTEPKPAFSGRFVSFGNIQALPQPSRKPHPPIVVGGHTPPAFRRAVQYGNGWYGFALDVEKTAQCLAGLHDAAARHIRPAGLGRLEISVTPREQPDLATVRRYAELGVDRLVLYPRPAPAEDALIAFIDTTASALVGKA